MASEQFAQNILLEIDGGAVEKADLKPSRTLGLSQPACWGQQHRLSEMVLLAQRDFQKRCQKEALYPLREYMRCV